MTRKIYNFPKQKKHLISLFYSIVIMGVATGLAFMYYHVVPENSANIAMIYILALVLISRCTTGYWYGIGCSLFAVVCVNYLFTYPYFEINFTLTGYPITFMGMLAITLLTSAMTSHLSRQAIVIAEREKLLAEAEKEKMRVDYRVTTAGSGKEGLSLTASLCPDVILLDLGLPDMDGLDVLARLRTWTSNPVIVVSARTKEQEKVNALDAGADDYITKPFGTSELMARIRTALRHSRPNTHARIYKAKDLMIDFEKRLITLEGREIHLTQIEFQLLTLLAENSGRVLTYGYIMNAIWGPYMDNNNQILRVNMANIRRKIEKNPAQPTYVFTEIGIGYRMLESEN